MTTLGCCVQGQDDSVEENEGTNAIFTNSATAPDIVFPYSVAVFLAQTQGGHGTGTQGTQALRSVNHVAPTTGTAPNKTINPTFPYLREVYNVVRNTSTNGGQVVPKYLRPLFGQRHPGHRLDLHQRHGQVAHQELRVPADEPLRVDGVTIAFDVAVQLVGLARPVWAARPTFVRYDERRRCASPDVHP